MTRTPKVRQKLSGFYYVKIKETDVNPKSWTV